MRICYLIDHLRPDGTQFVLKQLVAGLAARGHEQVVISLNDSYDSQLIKALSQNSTEVRIVGKWALISGVGLLRLYKWLQDGQFDVVVTLLFTSDVIGRALARLAKIPYVVSSLRARNIHYSAWQRKLVRATMPWADAVILNSTHVRDFAISQEGALPERIHIIPNGLKIAEYQSPISRQALCSEFALPLEHYLVGSVGRLAHQKGFDILLQALAMMSLKEVTLLLIGTGEEKSALKAQAAALGLQSRIHFAGYRRDVPQLLGVLDLYVHPARFEGMPNALLEAMAAGCAIVTTAVDGNRELIEDERYGWLVPPENVERLADAIQGALNEPIEAQTRATAARQRAATKFSIEAMVEAWERVLLRMERL